MADQVPGINIESQQRWRNSSPLLLLVADPRILAHAASLRAACDGRERGKTDRNGLSGAEMKRAFHRLSGTGLESLLVSPHFYHLLFLPDACSEHLGELKPWGVAEQVGARCPIRLLSDTQERLQQRGRGKIINLRVPWLLGVPRVKSGSKCCQQQQSWDGKRAQEAAGSSARGESIQPST